MTMTAEPQAGDEQDRLFVGYGPAAEYLKIKRNTLSSYMSTGTGPTPEPERRAVGQYNLVVFRKSSLDRWLAEERPGQGYRSDLPPKT